ncbi:SWIM zinc finger family protein [Streptomyces sp. NPDC056309]|uniref:SWIM zinc finger family protein n=1 Tax=unclassified Streptomyces TaxID=2593676 RepID=UPI0035DF64F8
MDERPADAARRALRAARDQQTRTPEGPADHRKPVPGDPAGAGSRPGDAARDALRRAVHARRGDGTTDDTDEPGLRPETPPADGAAPRRPAGARPSEAAAGEPAPRPATRFGAPADGAASQGSTGARPSEAARVALRGALARRAARAEATQAGTRAARRATRPTPIDPPAGTDAEHDGAGTHATAPTGPFRTPPAAPGHGANTNGNGPTDQESPEPRTIPSTPVPSGEDLSTAAIPTAARAAASLAALTRAQEDASQGVLTTGVTSGTPSDGSPSRTSQEATFVAPSDALLVGTEEWASADAPDSAWTVTGEGAPVGTPGAPSAGTPEAGPEGRRAFGRRTSPSSAGAGSGSASFSPVRAGAEPPVPPRVPRTMASPRRDGELRRTFPAFPARAVEGERFAETWWGDAWVDALEEGALDAARLARGRGYAQTGHVDAVTVTPGLVLAYVQGSRPRPYRVQVRLRTLDDADWDRFLDAVAKRPGHIAALLDKEMPQSLADCGVPLLPGPGDLEPHCSCPDRGHPCKHAAALCYQTARLLDADPFVLLLLRGRGERELLDALSRLNATRAARAAQEREPEPFPGVRAGEALAERRRPPLPAPLPAPPHPEQPPVYPAAPGGPDPFALDQLATDAAARAHALLTTGRDPVGGLTLWQDAVRLAAARPGSGLTAATRSLYASLASATGRGTAELARAVAAWRQGGLEGLAVLEEPWDPPAGRFDRARPLLLAADLPAFRPRRNRLTHPRGHLQLRLGRDGLWYAYESEPDRDDWWPRGTPDLDPVGALTGLGAPGAL